MLKEFSQDYERCRVHEWWNSFTIYCGHFERVEYKNDAYERLHRYKLETDDLVVLAYVRQEHSYIYDDAQCVNISVDVIIGKADAQKIAMAVKEKHDD